MRNSLFFVTIFMLSAMTTMVETTRAGDKPAANAGERTGAITADAAAPQKEAKGQPPDVAKSDKRTPPPDPNRRWIMRQRDYSGAKATPAKRKPLKWEGKAQQQQCAKYERQLSAHFDQARYFSIQGDRCKTAQYAHEFIEAAAICQSACPKDFLEYNGFSDEVQRNMHQLEALGKESCLGISAETQQTASTDPKTAAADRKEHTP